MLGKHTAAVEREHGFDPREFLEFHAVEYGFIDKQHDALRVVDDVHGILHIEVVKHRDNHGSIGNCGHVYLHPGDGVLTHERDLVAALHATLFEKHVGGRDAACQIGIGHGHTRPVFTESLEVPVTTESGSIYLEEVFFHLCMINIIAFKDTTLIDNPLFGVSTPYPASFCKNS